MLATLVDQPFDDEGWVFEIKWDGCRAVAYKNKTVNLQSRKEKSFNQRFPDIVKELAKIPGSFIFRWRNRHPEQTGKAGFSAASKLSKNEARDALLLHFRYSLLSGERSDEDVFD